VFKKISVIVLMIVGSIFLLDFISDHYFKVINVKEYGAAGDGVTDDTMAIQKALENGSNHKVYFPEGTYNISKELKLFDHTKIVGDKAVIKASSDLLSVFIIQGKNVSIHSLTIDGNDTSLRGITIAEGSRDVEIENSQLCHFTQPNDPYLSQLTVSAIRIEGGTSNITIDHNKIEHVRARNPVKGWGHLIARGILISPVNNQQETSQYIKISNSVFTNIGPKDDGDGIVVQGFKEPVQLEIRDNSFYDNHKRAIKIQSPGVLIKGNQIYNNFDENNFYTTYTSSKEYDMWAAISVYADYTTIENNTISGKGKFARIIDVSNASHVKIIGNHLENGKKGTSIVAITNNHSSDLLKDFIISDNIFVNGHYGIYTNSPLTNFNVSDNKQVNIGS